MMNMKLKKVMVWFGTVCMLNVLAVGCGANSESVAKTEEAKTDEGLSEEPQENTSSKWQVLEPDVAAAVDADFVGKVWKIEEDSFFIVEKKVKILEDGSLAYSSPSSNADIPDSQLIPVVFEDNTNFYIRTTDENGENYKDKEAGFQDLEEYMSVEMKGSFENDVFYATEIRLVEL